MIEMEARRDGSFRPEQVMIPVSRHSLKRLLIAMETMSELSLPSIGVDHAISEIKAAIALADAAHEIAT